MESHLDCGERMEDRVGVESLLHNFFPTNTEMRLLVLIPEKNICRKNFD
jgi:hypothetical protein